MSPRQYDQDRAVNPYRSPIAIAQERADRLEDPMDRHRFMEAFGQARVAEARDDRRLYLWFRAALDGDDSVRVAGLIEGAASVHDPKGRVI